MIIHLNVLQSTYVIQIDNARQMLRLDNNESSYLKMGLQIWSADGTDELINSWCLIIPVWHKNVIILTSFAFY